MKKKLPALLFLQFLMRFFSLANLHFKKSSPSRIKLSFLFSFICFSLWAQPPHTFNADGTVFVPAGITTMDIQAWGGGGAGGGASNSSALTGRGGGGGGGGGYAHANITVVAGTTLTAKVAVVTTGTASSGANGGTSTITGFESVILAAGGLGGTGNSTGGNASGGAGGTTSIGLLGTAAGTTGGVGNTALLNLGAASGGGGKGADPNGGAGGAGLASLLLGNSPGNPGTGPGGGGSGGMQLAGNPSQIGGNGAAGRVIVTYTCPTYNITGISAVNVCSSAGSTSLVTLTSTAALLPVGVYSVIYNTSSPVQTGLTALMTVTATSPRTATFTATGLTVVGTSNITVTSLQSGVCSSPISSSNVASVTVFAPTVGGSVTGGTTICSGAASGLLTLGGSTGTILKWQSSTDGFNTFTDIFNSTTTYTSGPLTATTQFRAVVQNGNCAVVNSAATTVTVNPLPQGTLTANGPFCVSGSGQLTFTASAGTGPYTVVYKENGGADRTATGVISGTAFAAFTNTVTATTVYTLTSVTDANCTRSSSFTGNSATITVNPLPQGTLTANGPFCVSGSGQLTFTASAGTGPYTVVYKENGGADRTATGVVSGTAFAAFTSTVTATTTYTITSVTDANCTRSAAFTGNSATITVNPLPQGSLTANGPFCVSGSGQLTFTASAGTGPYTVVYKENGGADRTVTGVVSGTAFAAFTNTVTATTTYTITSVTDANCTRSAAFTGNSATITVNPLPQGSLTANGPFCVSGSGQLTFTASAGTGPYTVVYKENGGADRTVTGVVSGTAFAAFTNTVTATTVYTLTSVKDANCTRSAAFTGNSATITINPLPQGSLTANGPFCVSGSGQLTFTASAGTGPYTVVYKENGGTDRTATGVVSGTAFAAFTNTVTATTVYTLTSVTDANCTRSAAFTGNSATITINPLPQGTLTANGPFCVSGSGQLTFTASAGTGPYTVVYKENGGADRTATGVVSGTAFAAFTGTVTATTVYTLTSITDANCTRSAAFTGNSAAITINPLPQGSLTANGQFCVSGSGQLTFTASAGTGPYTVVYKENGGADRTATGVVSGTAFAAFTGTVTATTVYTITSVTDANCTRSAAFTGNSATVTINPLPQGSLTANGPFCVSGSGQLTFTASAGTGPYTVVYKENGGADRTATGVISGTPFAAFTGTVTATTVYTLTSVSGANLCMRSAAFTGNSATITINPLPQGTLTANGPFCVSGSGQLTFTASAGTGPYTVVYKENGGADRTATGVISGTAFAAFTSTVTATTVYTLTSVTDANCTRSSGFTGGSASIIVNSTPGTPVVENLINPTCVIPTGSVVLSGLPAANWTINQIGKAIQTYSSSGSSYTISNLAPGNYTFTVNDGSPCSSVPVNLEIKAPVTNVWDGSAWSNGSPPIITDAIEFTGNYSTTGNLNGCSCTIDPGVSVTVNSNHTLTITNALTNNGGSMTFENNSSLLQNTNAVNTGNIIYKRNTTPVRRYDFTYWSVPVTSVPAFTLHDLSPDTLGDKYYSYDPNSGWKISYNGILPMTLGVGYIVRAPQYYDINTPAIYTAFFVGVPNNGPIPVPLAGAEKLQLIGNPYPSAVYADQFISDNQANLYGTLYFWTHNSAPSQLNYTSADYAVYNLSGGVTVGGLHGDGAGTPGNQAAPLGYIASGQSFFAKSKTGANALFTNSMRVAGQNSQFYKSSNKNKSSLERHRVWLNLTNDEGAFKQLLIGYVEGATDSWDNSYDGITMNSNKYLDFYSINEGRKLTIQGRALPFKESDFVPLGYNSTIAGEFSIAIDQADGDLATHAIYLEDKLTNTMHNLQTSNYTFTTEIGTFLDRFVLRYTAGVLGVGDFENQESNILISVKDRTIKINSTNELIKQVSVFDISGKLLYENKKIDDTQFQISNLQSSDQVLLVKLILNDGKTTTTKIVFH